MNTTLRRASLRQLSIQTRPALLLLLSILGLPAANFEIDWFTLDSGGGTGTDGFFALSGTIGQPDAVAMGDGFFRIDGGFWPAALRVKPFVALPPAGTNVDFGSQVTFMATPVGTPPFQFQWRLNGIDLPGETNATLTVPNAQLAQGGAYTWVVVNEFGVETSGPAELAFRLPLSPPDNNDYFANRTRINETNVIFRASNTNATREPGEPYHASTLGGASVWFTWSTNADGVALFRTRGSSIDTVLAVYTGSSIDQLSLVAEDDDDAGFLASEVRFNVKAATPYQIAVDGLGGRFGNFVLSWEFERTANALPQISAQPNSFSVLPGNRATLSVGAAQPGLTFQWYFNDAPVAGATQPTLALDPVLPSQLGIYRVLVKSPLGRELPSRRAALEFGSKSTAHSHGKLEDLLFASGVRDSAGAGGAGAFLPAAVVGSVADVAYNPVSVGTIGYQRFSNARTSSASSCHNYAIRGGAVSYYGLQAVDTGVVSLDTIGSTNASGNTLDTVLCIYEVPSVSQFLDFRYHQCNYLIQSDNNSGPDGLSAQLNFPVVAGRYYVVEVDVANGEKGTVQLNWQMSATPVPFEYAGDKLYLTTSTNSSTAGCEACDSHYYWYLNGNLHQTSSVPSLQLQEPLRPAATFSVVTKQWKTNGLYSEYTTLTNNLGSFLSTDVRLDVTPGAPAVQLVLDGFREPNFRIEASTGVATNAGGAWPWTQVTNYVVSTQATSLLLTFPAQDIARFYRVRPSTTTTASR